MFHISMFSLIPLVMLLHHLVNSRLLEAHLMISCLLLSYFFSTTNGKLTNSSKSNWWLLPHFPGILFIEFSPLGCDLDLLLHFSILTDRKSVV